MYLWAYNYNIKKILNLCAKYYSNHKILCFKEQRTIKYHCKPPVSVYPIIDKFYT